MTLGKLLPTLSVLRGLHEQWAESLSSHLILNMSEEKIRICSASEAGSRLQDPYKESLGGRLHCNQGTLGLKGRH